MSRHDSGQGHEPRGSPRGSAVHFWVAEGYAALLRTNGLDSLDALFACTHGELLSKPGLAGWRQRWRLMLRDGDRTMVLYMKRFTNPPRQARRAIRRSGSNARSLAGNEWTWIHRLTSAGIPCPDLVAFGEELHRGREIRSAVVTAAVPGRSLETWAAQSDLLDRPGRRKLLVSTATLAARLHGHDYIHRDLYLSHLFYDPSPASLCLIDLQRVIRPTCCFSRWRVKDLAALNYSTPRSLASNTDRLRWLLAYLGARKLDAAGKGLAYRVIGKTHQIARSDLRKTRITADRPFVFRR